MVSRHEIGSLTQKGFNQEKALVGAFSVITNLRMDLRLKLYCMQVSVLTSARHLSTNLDWRPGERRQSGCSQLLGISLCH